MVNAYSLLGSIMDNTFEKDYPLLDKDIKITSKESDEYDIIHPNDSVERAYQDYYGYKNDDDGLDYEIDGWETDDYVSSLSASSYYDDYMADIDDQRAHHFNNYGAGKLDYEPQRNHQYKYHEEEILKDIEEYVSRTYQGHYTGTKHEFRKVQTIDLMAARDIAAQFCQANILKYGSRYGSKDGRNKTDLLKVIHYAMLLLHFDGHYGEPSMPSGDFDQMP